jgi:hypothetical protein
MQSYDGKRDARAPAENGVRVSVSGWRSAGATGSTHTDARVRDIPCVAPFATAQVAISSSTSPSDITIRPPIRI